MRYIFAFAAMVCGMGGIGAMGPAALGQGTFTLELREATPQQVPALRETMRTCTRRAALPAEITQVPPGLPPQVTYFGFGLGEAPIWLLASSGDKPRLYADVDRTGDLSKAPAIPGTRGESGTWFDPVTLTGKDGQKVRVRFMSHSSAGTEALGCLHAVPAGCRMGKVKLGEKTYAVALIDGNLNGRYNDLLAGPYQEQNMDALVIDRNGDGQFDLFNPSQSPPEWSPLAKGVAVDGKSYNVTAAADGSQIEITAAEPKYGSLDLGRHQVRLVAFSDFGLQEIETKGEKIRVAAGRYSTVSGELVANDGKANWRLQFGGDPGRLGTFVVNAEETLSLPLGPPLAPTAKVSQAERAVLLEYVLEGRSGEVYAAAVTKDATRLPPPTLEVVDPSGKIIYTGAFAFG
jgi:hypothetical protein